MNKCELSTFDAWYAEYPRKEAKLAAQRAYMRALKNGVTHEKMVDGLARFNEYVQKRGTERKYIPLPATWINAGRYDDEYEEAKANGLLPRQILYWQDHIAAGKPVPEPMKAILRENGLAI